MTDNNQRIGRAEEIIQIYGEMTGDDEYSYAVTDLLADLRHFCNDQRVDFDLALDRSQLHYEAELAGDE